MISRTKQLVLTAAFALVLGLPAAANAQSSTQFGSVLDAQDTMYDYQVWAAPKETHYYVFVTYSDGTTATFRHETLNGANQFKWFLQRSQSNVWRITIVPVTEPGDYILIATFDKRDDAVQLGESLTAIGIYVDIRPVLVVTFNTWGR